MKKFMVIFAVFCLMLLSSLPADAFSFDLNASYYLGLTSKGIDINSGGFGASGKAGIIGDLWVDGSFLSTKNQQLVSGGILYRIVSERDLDVLLGGGYLGLDPKDADASELKGRGVYWRMALKYLPVSNLVVSGEISYVPFYKSGEEKESLVLGKAAISYELYRNLGVQLSVKNHKTIKKEASTGPLVGLGLAFRY
ncbi:MAG TPA: hypothetical protein GXZ55_02770 [Natronincola sp.]|nr:hypothetical protein [Natronincola sp.]